MTLLGLAESVVDVRKIGTALHFNSDDASEVGRIFGQLFAYDDVGVRRELDVDITIGVIADANPPGRNFGSVFSEGSLENLEHLHDAF